MAESGPPKIIRISQFQSSQAGTAAVRATASQIDASYAGLTSTLPIDKADIIREIPDFTITGVATLMRIMYIMLNQFSMALEPTIAPPSGAQAL